MDTNMPEETEVQVRHPESRRWLPGKLLSKQGRRISVILKGEAGEILTVSPRDIRPVNRMRRVR